MEYTCYECSAVFAPPDEDEPLVFHRGDGTAFTFCCLDHLWSFQEREGEVKSYEMKTEDDSVLSHGTCQCGKVIRQGESEAYELTQLNGPIQLTLCSMRCVGIFGKSMHETFERMSRAERAEDEEAGA